MIDGKTRLECKYKVLYATVNTVQKSFPNSSTLKVSFVTLVGHFDNDFKT
jgi:hypothetical protein